MTAALSNVLLRIGFTSRDPITDNPSIDLSYLTTFTTQTANDALDLANAVTSAIGVVPSGGTQSPSYYLSTVLSNSANMSTFEVYDVTNHLDGSRHGSPVVIGSWTLGTSSPASNMPAGVSCAVTLQAPYGTDVEFGPGSRPRARDRGRFYWGPLNNFAIGQDATTHRPEIISQMRTDMTKFVKAINVVTTATHTVTYNLAVWSRKNAAMKSLQECWVDDRPDYQRRRDDQSTVRTIQGLP
jgi:hypothetical protein